MNQKEVINGYCIMLHKIATFSKNKLATLKIKNFKPT